MRLIDADEFKNQDILEQLRTTEFDDEVEEVIKEIPTAYDVDKVVKQLEEKVKYAERKAALFDEEGNSTMMDMWDAVANSYRNSIKIVKSGGVANE